MLPEIKKYLDDILDVDEIPRLFTWAIAIIFAKELDLVVFLPLKEHLAYHGSHLALVVFLGSVDVEIPEARNLTFRLVKIAAGLVVKKEFGKSIDIKGLFTGRFFAESFLAAAIS